MHSYRAQAKMLLQKMIKLKVFRQPIDIIDYRVQLRFFRVSKYISFERYFPISHPLFRQFSSKVSEFFSVKDLPNRVRFTFGHSFWMQNFLSMMRRPKKWMTIISAT